MILVLLFASGAPPGAFPDGPGAPKSPEVPVVTPGGGEGAAPGAEVPVILVTARGGRAKGRLLAGAADLDVPVLEGNTVRIARIALADIDSIEFLRWRGSEARKNEFSFRPVRARITLRSGSVMESADRIPLLERLSFREGGSVRTVFSIFNDYRKKGRWVNSGATAMDYPETNPHGGTLVRILFERPSTFNPIDMLFREWRAPAH